MQLKANQKTHIPETESLKRKHFIIDAKGRTLGLMSTKIADLLRGKGKPYFTPQHDC
ncbi:uL13 family ribosomal protein, partial [Candidatus Peregrinibacteria bacterium]|nr:uL13 family ribosomal protein [Candidatus Peregrinibacteria bacterium]